MRGKWQILTIIIIVALAAVTIKMVPLNYGLDIKGGSHIVLEAQPTAGVKINSETMDKAKSVIERRVNGLGISEPLVQRQGTSRIIVELPGVGDRKQAIDLIGKTAQLEFQDPEGNKRLSGGDLKDAQAQYGGQYSRPVVSLEFTREGREKFAKLTQENIGKNVPIVLDGQVLTNPVVNQAITDGKAIIEGNMSMDEAKNLAVLLKGGALPVNLKPTEVRNVSPILEKESIQKSLQAGLVGVGLVLLYMLLFYKLSGLVADLALIVYGSIVLASMAGLHAVLTLPGIAGLVLSVGMAVDANVIIFERIREELKAGKRLHASISAGFNRALSSILDANITTLITAAILFYFGTGPIKGFAVTLGLGIVVSMFTCIVITRWLMEAIARKNPEALTRSFTGKGVAHNG